MCIWHKGDDFADTLYAEHVESAKSVPVRVQCGQKQQLEENVKKCLTKWNPHDIISKSLSERKHN